VLYVSLLTVTAALSALALVASGYRAEPLWVVVTLAVTAVLAERWRVSLSSTTGLTTYLLPAVFAAVVVGPLGAGIVAAAAMLGDPDLLRARGNPMRGRLSDRLVLIRWLTYTSAGFMVGAAAGFAAIAGAQVGGEIGTVVVASISAMAVAETLDLLFAFLTGVVRRRKQPVELLRLLAPVALTSFLVFTPIVILLAVLYTLLSPWALPLLLLPTLALQRLYRLYQNERNLAEGLASANETLRRANLSFAEALVATLDARDQYTAGHSAAVAIYSRDIAARMGLPPETQERIYLCGLVHDIGKIGLPAGLLEKPGALTLDERRAMQEHSAIGERILRNVDGYADIADVVRHHHERMDGEGYPDGLRGEDIPFLARIIAVADAYNAMTSNRPYRDAMPSRVARMRLAQAVESQFDTAVVAAFEAVLASAGEDYRMARRKDFRLFSEPSPEPVLASDSLRIVGAA
jgi:putative nucleotidyltransferase with HDIG domain